MFQFWNTLENILKPSLDDLYLFTEVASAGGLIRGAKRLGLPKSTVSRRLAKLERDVGAKLIDRDARHFKMTDIGKAYAEHAQRMVEAYSDSQDFLSQLDAKPRGTLRVAMPADFAIFFLNNAIASFVQAYPSVTLDIDASSQIVDIVAARFDVAIRMGKLADSNLIAKPLASLSRHFYASKSFLKKHGIPKSLDELSLLPFVALNANASNALSLTVPLNEGETNISLKHIVKTNSMGLTRSLAISGAGIALLPDAMAQAPLVRLLPDIDLTPVEAHFIISQRQWLPAKTRAFIEHLQKWCANNQFH
jgi:DNA-binding transcriptional LysR family regulator